MMVLGSLMDTVGSTETSVNFRLEKGERLFGKYRKFLTGHGPINEKLLAWSCAPVSAASFGSSTWHLTNGMLHRIKTWETEFLRNVFRMRRRVLNGVVEGRMQFNKRTSGQTKKWFENFGCSMMHERFLKAVRTAAWREQLALLPNHHRPLLEARASRSCMWWEAVKAEGYGTRKASNLTRSRPGPQAYWEGPLVLVYGCDWRIQREKCISASLWKIESHAFVECVCRSWRLPCLKRQSSASAEPPPSGPPSFGLTAEPDLQISDEDANWGSGSFRAKFVVDCQPLMLVMNGDTPLHQGVLDSPEGSIFERMGSSILRLLDAGVRPQQDHFDFVTWRKRDWNKLADFLVNKTMNDKLSWRWCDYELRQRLLAEARPIKLPCFSDGGLRSSSGAAAAAWMAFLWKPIQEVTKVGLSGAVLE